MSAHSPSLERRQRYRTGWRGELIASLYLRCRGYRIVARRQRTPVGEIDIVAIKGRRISFVEVKARSSFAAAEASVLGEQRRRVRRAATSFIAARPCYQAFEQTFDLVFIVPGRWPRHLVNAL